MNQGEIDVEKDGSGARHPLNYRMRTLSSLMSDWKDTLNLPRTDFPMKANLPATEPTMIAKWEAAGLHAKIRDAQKQKIPYMLVVGDKEQENGQVALRLRSGENPGAMSVADFIARARDDVEQGV